MGIPFIPVDGITGVNIGESWELEHGGIHPKIPTSPLNMWWAGKTEVVRPRQGTSGRSMQSELVSLRNLYEVLDFYFQPRKDREKKLEGNEVL